MYKINGKN